MEKNDFENFGFQKKLKILILSIEKLIFSSKNFTWKNRFFYWKTQNFQLFLDFKIFKIIFIQEKKTFFDDFFSCLRWCGDFKALCAGKSVSRQVQLHPRIYSNLYITVTTFFLEDLSYHRQSLIGMPDRNAVLGSTLTLGDKPPSNA